MTAVLAHFLDPGHALGAACESEWDASAVVETPGEDARCRIVLRRDGDRGLRAAFAAFGPPEVIACADWLCERVDGKRVGTVKHLVVKDLEQALSLGPTQRYAGAMVVDAFNQAIRILERLRYERNDDEWQ